MPTFIRYIFCYCILFFLFAHSIYSQENTFDTIQHSNTNLPAFTNEDISAELPEIIIADIESEIKIKFTNTEHPKLLARNNKINVSVNNKSYSVEIIEGAGTFNYLFETTDQTVIIKADDAVFISDVHPIPLWLSILPPIIAILMALAFREVVSALFTGIFIGAAIIGYYAKGIWGIFSGLLSVIDTYLIGAMYDIGHLSVILFSMTIGAIVTIISKNGGMQGVVNKISVFAKDAKSGQLATWFLGVAIFFDDYANTLIVGNTMRPITDKLRISREKLSYIVDSTAAPVAAIALVTTWIGAELGYIENGIAGISQINEGAYSIFFNSLQYSFYPVFTLLFMLILIFKQRDFGPMYKAEIRARTTGRVSNPMGKIEDEIVDEDELDDLQPVKGIKPKGYNAVIPIFIVVFGTVAGLFVTGWNTEVWNDDSLGLGRKMSEIIGASDSYTALLWASLCGLLSAIILTLSQKIMSLSDTVEAMIKGFKTMLNAITILVLAWSLALVTEHIHTADFITSLLSNNVSPIFIPAITFVLAAFVAFSTGSSWGTMAILYPLMLPASWLLCKEAGYEHADAMMIFYNVVSSVLAGSVLGDHCSPISDTTILSSLASSCNHIDHVRTQLPYAITVGLVAVVAGTIPAAMGISSWITMPVGLVILYAIVHWLGKRVEDKGTSEATLQT